MSDNAAPPASSSPPDTAPAAKWKPALLIVAIVVLASALTDLPGAFYDYEHDTTLLVVAQWLTTIGLLIAPVLAAAALFLVLRDRLVRAIDVLAAIILVDWLFELPSIAIHGLELSWDIGGITAFVHYFVKPVIAVAAIVLSRRGRLGAATLLVALPTIVSWLGVLAFAVGVMIYGF